MKFIDEAKVSVHAGDGGDGCVAFLREKYRPKGGPSGGDGGDGGDVVFVVDANLGTLLDFKYQPLLRARGGEQGRGKQQYGKRGEDLVVRIPPGTLVYDADTGDLLGDLRQPGTRFIAAQGGHGGAGNMHFASSTNQSPRFAKPGTPGVERTLRLELRLLADVGLVGFPSVGKSSLIRRVSAARPRVADYPFTTLVPHLGVVRLDEDTTFVLADIPGLIEGAHEGAGLGHQFLRHVARTAVLVHMLDISGLTGRDPLQDFETINRELEAFDPELASKPQIVAANKIDLAEARERFPELRDTLRARGIELWPLSAATGEGIRELLREVASTWRRLREQTQHDEGTASEE